MLVSEQGGTTMLTEAEASIPLEDWLITLYVVVDTWWQQEGRALVPTRPGPVPVCSDPELLTLHLAREFLGWESERAWRAAVVANWSHLFPHVPAQSEWNRRVRWLRGACEALRAWWTAAVPLAPGAWLAIDTTPVAIKHPSRVRQPTASAWHGPNDVVVPGFGYCAALAHWFYGFRLALLTGLTDGVIRGWGLVPAAVDERLVADDLLAGVRGVHLLTDQGFRSQAWSRHWAEQHQVQLLTTPSHEERRDRTRPAVVHRFVATFRNRIETVISVLKERFHLERHRAKTFDGLFARVAAKLAAHTFKQLWPLDLIPA